MPKNALNIQVINRNNRAKRKKPDTGYESRTMDNEGYLGAILKRKSGEQIKNVNAVKSMGPHIESIAALSFYNYLPPPDFMENVNLNGNLDYGKTPKHLKRANGRTLDLSHMVPMRRLIIIGHIRKDARLPLPLKVDGDTIRGEGWTVVRFILPIDQPQE